MITLPFHNDTHATQISMIVCWILLPSTSDFNLVLRGYPHSLIRKLPGPLPRVSFPELSSIRTTRLGGAMQRHWIMTDHGGVFRN